MKPLTADVLLSVCIALFLAWFGFGIAVRDFDPTTWGMNAWKIVTALFGIGFASALYTRRTNPSRRQGR